MAHSLSAKKRVRQNAKRKMINRTRKGQVKTQVKQFQEAVAGGNVETAEQKLRLVAKKLDQAASKSSMHKRTAARKKSRLAAKLNEMKASNA